MSEIGLTWQSKSVIEAWYKINLSLVLSSASNQENSRSLFFSYKQSPRTVSDKQRHTDVGDFGLPTSEAKRITLQGYYCATAQYMRLTTGRTEDRMECG